MKNMFSVHKEIILVSLIFTLTITISSCKQPVVDIQPGSKVEYAHTSTAIPTLASIKQGEFLVEKVNGDVIEFSATALYKDGTTEKTALSINRKTGEGNAQFAFVRPGLNKDDQVYDTFPSIKVKDVIKKSYDGQRRDVLVIEIPKSGSNLTMEIDQETGVILQFITDPSLLTTSKNDSINTIPSETVEFSASNTNLW